MNDNDIQNLLCGFKIKGLRLSRKLAPKTVAEALDITPTYLSLIENGKKVPSKKVVKKASQFFEIAENDFYTKNQLLEKLREILEDAPLEDVIQAFEYSINKKQTPND